MEISEFKKELSDGLTVVDFWAPWCGPCRVLHPILDRLQEKNTDVKIVKINVDESADLTKEFGIRNIPTVLFFSGDQEVERVSGVKQEPHFQELIDKHKK